MTQKEFEKIIKMYGEIKDFARTEKRLRDVLGKLEEVKKMIKLLESFNKFTGMMDMFLQQNWMLKDFFTIGEAADFLGVKYSSVRSLIEQKAIPYYIVEVEDKTLIMRDELIEWIQKNRMISQKEIEENALKIMKEMKKRQARNRANMARRKARKFNEEVRRKREAELNERNPD